MKIEKIVDLFMEFLGERQLTGIYVQNMIQPTIIKEYLNKSHDDPFQWLDIDCVVGSSDKLYFRRHSDEWKRLLAVHLAFNKDK